MKKKMTSAKIKRVILNATMILGTIGIISVVLSGYLQYVQKMEQARVDQTVRESAIQSVALIVERLQDNMVYIESVGDDIAGENAAITDPTVLQMLPKKADTKKIFKTITVATPEGDLYDATGVVIGNIANRTYFQKAMRGETVISNMEKSPDGQKEIISVTAPIVRAGKIMGIVDGRFLMTELTKYLSASIFDGRGYSYMANADGNVFIMSNHPDADPKFKNIYEGFKPNPSVSDEVLAVMLQNMKNGQEGQIFYEWRGEKRTMGYMPVGINDWYLLTVIPNDIVSARTMEFSRQVLMLTGTLMLVLLLVLRYIQNQRRKNQQELAAANDEILKIYNTIPGGVFKCQMDAGCTVADANDGFYRFVGYSREEFTRKYANELIRLMPLEDREKAKASLAEQLQCGQTVVNEVRLISQDGTVKWILVNGDFSRTSDGKDLLYCCFTDISELKQMQEELNQAHKESSRLYNLVASGIFRCRYDEQWTLLDANEGFYRVLGYTKEEFATIYHNEINRVIHPEDQLPLKVAIEKQLQTSNAVTNEHRFICANQQVKWIWSTGELVEEQGQKCFYCSMVDISTLKETQENLRIAQQRYELIMAETQDIIFEWNIIEKTVYYAKNYEKKFGYSPMTENFPQSILENPIVYPEDQEDFWEIYHTIEAGAKSSSGEVRIKKLDGTYLWCRIFITALRDEQDRLCRIIGIIVDIDQTKRELQKVKEMARRDSLTGLYNKSTTERLIEVRLQATKGISAFLMLDIDNFKNINDTLGHARGDAVLLEMSNHLKALFRTVDIVGRVGGDEFVIFLEGWGQEPEWEEKLLAITEVFQRSFCQESLECVISCSIGVVMYPRDGDTFAELYRKADIALYFAKQHGKNRFAIYNESMRD